METYYLTRTGQLFSWLKAQKDAERPANEWITLDIDYEIYPTYSNQSNIISVEIKHSEPS